MSSIRYKAVLLLSAVTIVAAAAADFGLRSCCELTRDELEAAAGVSDLCPSTILVTSIDKCETCPSGTCRVDRNCYCPGAFLEHYDSRKSYGVWNNCESSFSEKYPDSIGKEDVDWRSCKKGAQVTDFGSKSCCELTEDELQAAAGTSDLCPTNIQVASIDKCETCPPGTCRVDRNCYCPGAFLDLYQKRKSYGVWKNCESSFSEKYPDSIGMEDVAWRSCAKQDPVTSMKNGGSLPVDSNGGTASATDASSDKGEDDGSGGYTADSGVGGGGVANPKDVYFSPENSFMCVSRPQQVLDVFLNHFRQLNACSVSGLKAERTAETQLYFGAAAISGVEAVDKVFSDFCRPFNKGGLRGMKFSPDKMFIVGNTISVRWTGSAPFLERDYPGSDAYVTCGDKMVSIVSSFNESELPINRTRSMK